MKATGAAAPDRFGALSGGDKLEEERRARRGILALYVLVVGVAVIVRLLGLDPLSLWWDDLWVATLAKAPLTDALATPAQLPPGFVLILWVLRRVFCDPEWPLQLCPFFFGLAIVPLVGWSVERATESPFLGLAAAALIAVNPLIAGNSVFVKQYTLDASATSLFLVVSPWLLGCPTPRRIAATALLGFTCFLFSLNSIFASVAALHLACLFALCDGKLSREAIIRCILLVLAFDLLVVAWFFVDVRHRTNPMLVAYYFRHFLPRHSFGAARQFLSTRGWSALGEALPPQLQAGTLLIFPGIATLLARASTRRLGVFLVIYLVEVLLASALHYVPLGGKTSIFLLPVTLVLVVAALDALPRSLRSRKTLHRLIATGAVALAVLRPFPARYYGVDDAYAVGELATLAGDEQSVLVYPRAGWMVAYYAGWPYRIERGRDWVCNFQARFLRPNTVILSPRRDAIDGTIARLTDQTPSKSIFYLATRQGREMPEAEIFASLERRGFRGKLLLRTRKAVLYVFRPSGGPSAPFASGR